MFNLCINARQYYTPAQGAQDQVYVRTRRQIAHITPGYGTFSKIGILCRITNEEGVQVVGHRHPGSVTILKAVRAFQIWALHGFCKAWVDLLTKHGNHNVHSQCTSYHGDYTTKLPPKFVRYLVHKIRFSWLTRQILHQKFTHINLNFMTKYKFIR